MGQRREGHVDEPMIAEIAARTMAPPRLGFDRYEMSVEVTTYVCSHGRA